MEGCKERCIYCNQNTYKGYGEKGVSLYDFVLKEREKFKNKKDLELAFYGGTFFNLSTEKLISFKKEILALKEKGVIKSARASTTPDSINIDLLKIFEGVLDRVEIGLQSLDDFVLKIIRRNYKKKDIFLATKLLKKFGYEIGFQIMVGLPYESRASFINNINEALSLTPDFVRLYPLFVLKDTPLSSYYKLKIFQVISLEELICRCSYAVSRFESSGIKVIKIGLNEFLDNNKLDFVHNHNDLRGLIMTNIFKNTIINFILENKNLREISIFCNSSDLHYAIGVNRQNVRVFQDKGINLKIRTGEVRKGHLLINGKEINVFKSYRP